MIGFPSPLVITDGKPNNTVAHLGKPAVLRQVKPNNTVAHLGRTAVLCQVALFQRTRHWH